MAIAKIGKRGVLVIPASIRQRANLKEGDDLLVEIDDYGGLHIIKKPQNYVEALRGFHQEIWKGIDPVAYVREERQSWKP